MGDEKSNTQPVLLAYASPDRSPKTWPVVLTWVGIGFSVPTLLIGLISTVEAWWFRGAGSHEALVAGALLWQVLVGATVFWPARRAQDSALSSRLRTWGITVNDWAITTDLVAGISMIIAPHVW